jgi:hypothetical protein
MYASVVAIILLNLMSPAVTCTSAPLNINSDSPLFRFHLLYMPWALLLQHLVLECSWTIEFYSKGHLYVRSEGNAKMNCR